MTDNVGDVARCCVYELDKDDDGNGIEKHPEETVKLIVQAIHTAVNDARRPLVDTLKIFAQYKTMSSEKSLVIEVKKRSEIANQALTQDTSRYGEL